MVHSLSRMEQLLGWRTGSLVQMMPVVRQSRRMMELQRIIPIPEKTMS